MNQNDYALVKRPSSAVEKAAPGAKRVLSGMVADALALAKEMSRSSDVSEQRTRFEFDLQWDFEALNCARITGAAKEFVSNIQISGNAETADGKNVMEVMMLALQKGSHIKVSANGPDAPAAIQALKKVLCRDEISFLLEFYKKNSVTVDAVRKKAGLPRLYGGIDTNYHEE
jgi:phosphotransferase system HPr (HPr) family protein